ncbi:hypothetical protein ACTMSW_27190 [Micromonospora sp. BQ11]|uniref:hypothetical protein n=1 Tax=Micromonospora sp. BQ11 TaxID=3452212 RepID=UPI003F8BEFD2
MAERRRATPRSAAAISLLALLAGVAACGDAPVAPLPVQPPAPSTATPGGSATVTAPTPPSPAPPTAATTTATTRRPPASGAPIRTPRRSTPPPSPTTLPDACLGAVRYDLVLAETELALVRSLCFATGGVLRIRGIGPGEVTVDREDLVSRSYEAGVVDIRFVRVGTVVVTIPQNGTAYPITVVVV